MLVILKSTHECNLRCAYCYEREGGYCKENSNITNTFDKLVTRLADENSLDHTRIILHGGEPLMLPVGDLDHILGHKAVTSIQTNLTLVTDAHIDMFKKYGTSVCTSYDGIFEDELKHHRDKQSKVVDNIHRLRAAGVNCSILAVLTKQNSTQERLDELFKQLVNLTDKMQFNLGCGFDQLNPIEAGSAMLYLARKCVPYIAQGTHSIQPFEQYISGASGDAPTVCSLTQCMNKAIIGVMPNGDVTPCLRWETGAVFGNLHKDSISTMLNVAKRNFAKEVYGATSESCKSCKYFDRCGGGCPAEVDPATGVSIACSTTQVMYDYMISGCMESEFPLYNFKLVVDRIKEDTNKKREKLNGCQH